MVNEQEGLVQLPKTSEILFESVKELGLYSNLIAQLNKDFLLANLDEEISENATPESLKKYLENLIFSLLNTDYDSYLKLLYIVDVSEHKLKQLHGGDFKVLSEQLCFQILLREWQKVWYRQYY